MSILIIEILRFIYHFFGVSKMVISLLTILAFFLSASFLVIFIVKAVQNVKTKAYKYFFLDVGATVLFLLSAIKFTYYFDWSTKTIQPELVVELNGTIESDYTETFFKIRRFPFVLKSMYTGDNGPKRSFSQDIDLSELQAIIDVDEPYTYIISYGRKIDKITYNCWDGKEYLPSPWNGQVMEANCDYEAETDSNPRDKIYIYRIPSIPIDKEP